MFHPLPGMTQDEVQSANVKEFTGDGTPYLKVPGLLSLESVRVGTQHVPLILTQKFPKDHTGKEHETVDTPLVVLEKMPDGCPVLMRNIQSNNGMWQAGVPIFISGEWEKAKPARSAPAKTEPEKVEPEKTPEVTPPAP